MRFRLPLSLLLFTAALAGPATAVSQSGIVQGYVEKGVSLYRQGDFKEAIHFFQQAVAKDPKNPHYHSLLGSALYEDKQFYPAVFTLKKGLELDPGSVHLLNNIGTVYRDMKLYQQAEDAYRQAIASNPDYPSAWRNLGVLLAVDLGKPSEAITCWETYLRLDPAAEDAGEVRAQIAKIALKPAR
jgi:tetratricopeptide (TPR) repeat protein